MENELQNKIEEAVKLLPPADAGQKQEKKFTEAQKANWFKPGQSGNPEGMKIGTRKPKVSITNAIREKLMQEVVFSNGERKKYLDLLVAKIFDEALTKGEISLLREIWHYIDGMPAQPVKFAGQLNVNEVPFTESQFHQILDAYLDSRTHERLAGEPSVFFAQPRDVKADIQGEN